MAFAYTVDRQDVFGARRIKYGTYTNSGGGTGGTINTGLDTVETFLMQPTGASVSANQPVVNGTFPITADKGAVVVVNSSNELGTWFAIGV